MIGSDLNLYRQMQHHQDGLLAEARQQRLVNAARRARVDGVAASAAPTLYADRGPLPRRAAAPTPRAPRLWSAAARFGGTVGRMGARLAALDRRFLVR